MIDACKEFSGYLDTGKMKNLFQQQLESCRDGAWQLTGCQIQHPRYKTYLNPKSRDKSYLALAYHLSGFEARTRRPINRIFYVKVFLGERSFEDYAMTVSKCSGSDSSTVMQWSQYRMVGWFFPHDPVFPWLASVSNTAGMKQYFSDFFSAGAHNKNTFSVKDMVISVMNYRPEIRCTSRYDIESVGGNTRSVFGKTFADESGFEAYRRMNYLHSRTINNMGNFVIPKPLGYDEKLRTLWTEGLTGKPLMRAINPGNSEKLMTRLALNLVNFHGISLSGLDSIITEDDVLGEMRKKCAKLQHAFPNFFLRIENLLMLLSHQRSLLPIVSRRLVHGDFHLQQLLLMEDESIVLFDFDELAIGNPLIDLANFSADLYNLDFGKELTNSIIHCLLGAYDAFSDDGIDYDQFDWYFRIQLMIRAYRAYIQQKPNFQDRVDQFLTHSEYGFGHGQRETRHAF